MVTQFLRHYTISQGQQITWLCFGSPAHRQLRPSTIPPTPGTATRSWATGSCSARWTCSSIKSWSIACGPASSCRREWPAAGRSSTSPRCSTSSEPRPAPSSWASTSSLTAAARSLSHPRIRLFEGSSTDAELGARVKRELPAGGGLVILDSDHTKQHGLAELNAYKDLVAV